jgi:N-carbamoylputrescine amidase
MASLCVALVQARSPGAHPELALREGTRRCREAAARGADVVLFPELWQLGYTSWRAEPARRAEWLAHATTRDGPFVSHFRALARELGVAIVITYLEAWPGAPRNTATLIDRHGDTVLTYATWPRSTSATGARSRSAASGTTARATPSSTSSSRAARARSS